MHATVVSACASACALAVFASHFEGPQLLVSERIQAADVSLTNVVSDPEPVVGSQVTFRITVANSGPGPVRLVVRDRLPAGYSYVSHGAARGTYDPRNGYWSGFGVAPRGSLTLSLVATVNEGGSHSNVAEVMASSAPDPDSTPGNGNISEDDYAEAATTPRAGGHNIVVLMLDDLDTRSLTDLLNADLMPNLQSSVIDRGVAFEEAYVSTPLCCPSRASFLKGQYPHNTGIVANELMTPDAGLRPAVSVFDDTVTIATRLQSLGYTTAHVGKYLNGYGSDATLTAVSPAFDPHYVPPGWSHWRGLVDFRTYCVYDYTINADGVLTTYERPDGQTEDSATYQTNVLADLAESFVLDHRDDTAPFYLEVMPLAPHAEHCRDAYGGPAPPPDSFPVRIRPDPQDATTAVPAFVLGPAYDEDLTDKPDWLSVLPPLSADDLVNISEQYEHRLRAMLSLDRLIGRLIAALGSRLDDTIIVVTSDNGWLYGEHRLPGKIYAYRESARVPFYIVAPQVPSGTRSNLVLNNDLAPTLLDLASPGYADPAFDGRSLAPLLRNPQPPDWEDRSQVLIEYSRPAASMVAHRTYAALRSVTRLYIESRDGVYYQTQPQQLIGLELYDLTADPNEMTSLLHYPENGRDPVLAPLLDQLVACAGESCRQHENAPGAP